MADAVTPLLVDQVAAKLRAHGWAYQLGEPAHWLADAVCAALRVYFCSEHAIHVGPPIMVGGVAVTVTTAAARGRVPVRAKLKERAARDDVTGQVLVATGGAGIGHPAMIGGKPCALVYLRAQQRGA